MTLFLNVMVVVTALAWTVIAVNIFNDIKHLLEQERPEQQPSTRVTRTFLERKH